MKKLFSRSPGQIAVLYAGMITTLVAAIGLGADVAVMYVNWQQLQKAADAAALAGASYLPYDTSSAQSAATTYAENNGAVSSEVKRTTVSANDLSITVSLSRTVPYYFAQVLGMTNQLINVSATAGIEQNGGGGRGLLPLGLSCPNSSCSGNYVVGTTYTMKQDQSQTSLPGNWGALALGANGAAQFQQNLEIGYNGSIENAVATEPGNIVGPTQTGITDRVNAGVAADPAIAAGSAPSSATAALTTYAYDPRLVVVPLVDYTGGQGGKNGNGNNPGTGLPVAGYALMWLLGISPGNKNATVSAVYLGTTTTPPSGSSAVTSFGLENPILQG